ncbi:MAG: PTS sugar transporter subunit IIA [Ignavibacteriales bacterium]|jgi:fructose-specific phosphotransferase system IIA component|nr:PTS sugar transporter subunit IIA [Ignavibacteriaceae bacterium]NLH62432.1 PTS sugar transporter subunit IIA [Ignavibacteriales bacterium]HOJ18679.1 PTS sugar transporter subunit IIA [Ignavibacteriaceae bacterium]HPO55187.1 PTS sugar transporter subunit IIA [Ignavibacteriaceae bacterium]
MKLSELLSEEVIIPDLSGNTKEEVINQLIDLFKNDSRVNDIEKVRIAVMDREKVMSTGVGKGFAIPHGKTDAVKDILCAFGKSKLPIDYQSLDSQPVHLVFLLIGKDNLVSMHIKLLSRISRMMTKDSFRDKLLLAESKDDILEIFREEEKSYFEL